MKVFTQTLEGHQGSGLRVAIKDTIDIAGLPTRAGTRARAYAEPAERNAAVVDRILAAGCRIVGKTTLHELAFGVTGINDHAGTPVNPRWPRLVPGGSSSGSAVAVAADLADFAVGTDTGGSIRIPAACCGVFGLKPTFGRISREGVLPRRSSIDCVGPLAPSARGLCAAMAVLDPTYARHQLRSPRIGLVEVDARPEILGAVSDAIGHVGLVAGHVRLPHLEAAFRAGVAIINAETYEAFGSLLETCQLGDDVMRRLRAARETTPDDVAAANQIRAIFRAEVDARLADYAVLVLPTLPDFPPTLSEARSDLSAVGLTRLVRPFNLSGHPAATVPLLPGDRGPIGLQIIGQRGDDALVIDVARKIAAGCGRD